MGKLGILVLAGGGSERLGREKAFFEINGKSMIQQVVEKISKLSKEIVISCRSGREKLVEMFPRAKVVVDKDERKGALTGLVRALPEIRSEYTALVTCDCPKIKLEVIELLFENARNHDGAVPRWPNGYVEPLQAVYETEKLRKAVNEVWKREKMRLMEVLKIVPDIVYVSTQKLRKIDPKLESFMNVNSPEDIELLSTKDFE
jgi:molybdopterin-guanine dinucleotide biosynthesis protein A